MSTLMDFAKKNKALVSEHFLRLQVVEKFFEIMEEKKITQSQLAKKMKLSKSQISRLLSDDRNLTLSSIARIFFALGEEVEIITKSQVGLLKGSPNHLHIKKEIKKKPFPNILQPSNKIK